MRIVSVPPSPRSTHVATPTTQQNPPHADDGASDPLVISIDAAHLREDELEVQRALLGGRHAGAIRHLDVRITGTLSARQAAAIGQALRQCTGLQSLVLRYDGEASAELVNAVCQHVADHEAPLENFSLSFEGSPPIALGASAGMKSLLCKAGLRQLHCGGALAAHVALASLEYLPPDTCTLDRLTVSGIDPADEDAVAQMIGGLQQSHLHIDLRIDVEEIHPRWIDRLIEIHTRGGKLDHQGLLSHCLQMGRVGAQTFALACARQASPDQRMPVVPIEHGELLGALREEGVSHVVGCRFPSDLPALLNCDPTLIKAMELEFEQAHVDLNDPALAQLATVIQNMTELRLCLFRQAKPSTADFVHWLCSCLVAIREFRIEHLRINLPGRPVDHVWSGTVVSLMSKPSLRVLECCGRLVTSLMMYSLQQMEPENIHIRTLMLSGLPRKSQAEVVQWLEALDAPNTTVVMRFMGRFAANELVERLGQLVKKSPPWCRLSWLSIVTASWKSPIDSELARTLTHRGISRSMLLPGDQPGTVTVPVGKILKKFALSVPGLSGTQDVLEKHVLPRLDLAAVEAIGSTTKATYAARREIHLKDGAYRWAWDMTDRGYLSRSNVVPVLTPRVGEDMAREIAAAIWRPPADDESSHRRSDDADTHRDE